jgi:hypothetical protein
MQARHIKRLGLILVAQCILVAAMILTSDQNVHWLPAAFGVCFWVVPFVSYIVALYDAPALARWSPFLRAACLPLLSAVMTLGGGLAIFFSLPLIEVPIMPH